MLQHDLDKPEDLDTEAEDHAADSVRHDEPPDHGQAASAAQARTTHRRTRRLGAHVDELLRIHNGGDIRIRV